MRAKTLFKVAFVLIVIFTVKYIVIVAYEIFV
jgi:hypothetical protein